MRYSDFADNDCLKVNPTNILAFSQGNILFASVSMSAILHQENADRGTVWALHTESSQVSKPAGSFCQCSVFSNSQCCLAEPQGHEGVSCCARQPRVSGPPRGTALGCATRQNCAEVGDPVSDVLEGCLSA